MSAITYIKGDATCPQAKGTKLIVHICNDLGGWGKGFVVAISKRWPKPEEAYREWHRQRGESVQCLLGLIGLQEVGKRRPRQRQTEQDDRCEGENELGSEATRKHG